MTHLFSVYGLFSEIGINNINWRLWEKCESYENICRSTQISHFFVLLFLFSWFEIAYWSSRDCHMHFHHVFTTTSQSLAARQRFLVPFRMHFDYISLFSDWSIRNFDNIEHSVILSKSNFTNIICVQIWVTTRRRKHSARLRVVVLSRLCKRKQGLNVRYRHYCRKLYKISNKATNSQSVSISSWL